LYILYVESVAEGQWKADPRKGVVVEAVGVSEAGVAEPSG
jgi:hypothetical protein